MATGKLPCNALLTKTLKERIKTHRKIVSHSNSTRGNAVSVGTTAIKPYLTICLVGLVWFARYCGKMYSRHLFSYGGLERLSFERRKVIGFVSTTLDDGHKKIFLHFFIQSNAKPKPIVTRDKFSRALCVNHMQLLRVLIDSLYFWCPLLLARVITLVSVLRHSIENHSRHLNWFYESFAPLIRMQVFSRTPYM